MARDLTKAAERFLRQTRRIQAGLETQRQRILDREAHSPKLLRGGPYEVTVLEGPGIDLDYYAYDLARLWHIAHASQKVFKSEHLRAARDRFDEAIPHLKKIRDALTHTNDDASLDDVAFFSSIDRMHVGGRVESLISPKNRHHDAAIALSTTLSEFFSGVIQDAIAADPARPIDEQIARRERGLGSADR